MHHPLDQIQYLQSYFSCSSYHNVIQILLASFWNINNFSSYTYWSYTSKYNNAAVQPSHTAPGSKFTMSFCRQFALRVTSPSHESASVCTCTLLCIPLLHFTTMKMPQCALCPITLLRIKSSVCIFVVLFVSFRKRDSYVWQNTGWNICLFRFRLSIIIQTARATGTRRSNSWQRVQPTATLSAVGGVRRWGNRCYMSWFRPSNLIGQDAFREHWHIVQQYWDL